MQEPGTTQSQQTAQPSMYTPSTSAPIPEPSGYIPPAMQSGGANDSGTGATAVLPEQLRGFSWGAFFMNWIWAINHRTWWGLLALLPYIGVIMVFVLGFKGNEWAWQNRRWDSIEHFKATQRVWMMWGIGLTVGSILLAVVFGGLAAILGNR